MLHLRAETPGDEEAIRELCLAAFGRPGEAALVDALRQSGMIALSLVAEEGNDVLGHILFSTLLRPAGCLAVGPLCVKPSRQGEGIGSRLMQEGLAKVRQMGYRGVFLVGDPDYYGRFGFTREAAAVFETAYPKDYFMALALRDGGLDGLTGDVAYASPFADVE